MLLHTSTRKCSAGMIICTRYVWPSEAPNPINHHPHRSTSKRYLYTHPDDSNRADDPHEPPDKPEYCVYATIDFTDKAKTRKLSPGVLSCLPLQEAGPMPTFQQALGRDSCLSAGSLVGTNYESQRGYLCRVIDNSRIHVPRLVRKERRTEPPDAIRGCRQRGDTTRSRNK